jgi:S1-C subfamily serine protease
VQVEAGSPADTGGIRVGDVVVRLDGGLVLGDQDLMAAVRDLDPGTSVVLGVVRAGVPVDVPVVLGARAAEK